MPLTLGCHFCQYENLIRSLIPFALLATPTLLAQEPDFFDHITKGRGRSSIAVPNFRGSGDAQRVMDIFNQTLWDALE